MNLIVFVIALIAVLALTGFECYREDKRYKKQVKRFEELIKNVETEIFNTQIQILRVKDKCNVLMKILCNMSSNKKAGEVDGKEEL